MSKSKSLIIAKPHKFRKDMTKKVNRKMASVQRTHQSQLRADPGMEMRKALFMSRPINIYGEKQ